MSLPLALVAARVSTYGFQAVTITNMLASSSSSNSWNTGFNQVLGLLNMIGLVLAFGGLLFAAVMFMMGQTERVLYGVVGAVIGGLAWVITKTMFQNGSGGTISIDLGAPTSTS